MSKSENQKAKILYVAKFLLENTDENNGASMPEIIEYLKENGISAERKGIYTDIGILREIGLDIIADRGKDFKYYIGERTFELAELKLLVDSVLSSKFITKKKTKQLIEKLSTLTSEEQAKELYRQVEVVNRVKINNEKIYYNVDAINEAITEKKQISFYYYEWIIDARKSNNINKIKKRDGEKYEVSPLTLMWDDENYYLVAYDNDSKALKHYRVDKMDSVEILDENIISKKGLEKFDSGVYAKQVFGMYGGELENVTLEFDNSLIGVVVDRFSDKVVIKPKLEKFTIKPDVVLSPQFYAWMFSFGSKARIVAPSSAVNEFKKYIEEVKQNYE